MLAADNRINALAAALKADGAPASMDQLRAQVYLNQLLGRPAAAPAEAGQDPPPGPSPGPGSGPADDAPPGASATQGPAAAPNQDHTTHRDTTHRDTADGGAAAGDTADASDGSRSPADDAPPGASAGPAGPVAPAGGAPPADDLSGGGGPGGAGEPPGTRRPVPAPQDAPAGPLLPAGPLHPTPPLTPAVAGSVNLTIPLPTLLGLSSQPAEAAGFGPLTPAATNGILAAARAGGAAVRWCVTVTGQHGQPAGHGCATRKPQQLNPGIWGFTLTVHALETRDCAHTRQSAAYQPPPKLRHLIQARHRTCCFPGCGRPAKQCDLDHTIPYGAGGLTCECNLAPLCEYHHDVKHSPGWRLTQPRPGVLQWNTPSGWKYITNPDAHPT